MSEEWFDLLNDQGEMVGSAPRCVCHTMPGLLHRAAHVLVFNSAGNLFLQKRSSRKDIQPGKWDTSVGGHPNLGENNEAAARREMREELGVEPAVLEFAYSYRWKSPVETEWITSFATVHPGPFHLDPVEIDEGRFWTLEEIQESINRDLFTPQFQHEFSRILAWKSAQPKAT